MANIGDTVVVGGEEFEVVWAGGEGLVAPRESKPGDFWEPPPRSYNKKSDYWSEPHGKTVDKPEHGADYGEAMVLRHGDPNEDVADRGRSVEREASEADREAGSV